MKPPLPRRIHVPSRWLPAWHDPFEPQTLSERVAARQCASCDGTGLALDAEDDDEQCPVCRGTGLKREIEL